MTVNHFGPYKTSDTSTWITALSGFTTSYGPYIDVTDYVTWQNALTAGVTAGNEVVAVQQGTQITFLEVTNGSSLSVITFNDQLLFVENTST